MDPATINSIFWDAKSWHQSLGIIGEQVHIMATSQERLGELKRSETPVSYDGNSQFHEQTC
jgi:hypothetical protein